ncbi:MAG TPA: transglycosylase domain-containing protein [Candidatus Limnocylindria bacterium]|nr:transglycosylase domain-containing protein [Candidatus Limnocylindria bacterium]
MWLGLLAMLPVAALLAALSVRMNALIDRHAAGPSWRFPSRVYSDGVELSPGHVLPQSYLVAQLVARKYRPNVAPLQRPGTYAVTAGGLEIYLRGFLDALDPNGNGGPERVRLVVREGFVVQVDRLGGLPGARAPDVEHPPRIEPELISMLLDEDRIRRSYVTLDRVPQVVQDAVVAAEDRRFFDHLGFDVRATLRALRANLRSGEIREGGSTITQQLARGLFLGNRRTWARKLAELPLALGIEMLLDKQRILEMYLNMVYWGQAEGGGIGGIAEAARWHFETPVESLRIEQAALLAGIIRAPNAIAPFEHPSRALESRNRVLDDLVAVRKLDAGEATRFKALPLGLRRGRSPIERFPSYTGYVRQTLEGDLAREASDAWGLMVFTTMDLAHQIAAEQELRAGIERLEGGRRGPPLEGAFVALQLGTGAVRALVGGRALEAGDFNRATQARRQTGSAIKPIVYAATFAEGGRGGFTPATTVPDEPRTFGRGKWAWRPRNFGDSYHPTATLAIALTRSLNLATANVVEAIGPATVARFAERFGLGRLKPVMSIGLGTNEVTPLQLTSAFAVFADGGIRRAPSPLRSVVDSRGRVLIAPSQRGEEVISAGIAALMTGLLQNVVQFGVAVPLRVTYGFDRPVAGKTGTTDNYYDAWFVGFTPHLISGVWLGYDKPRSIGREAAHTALPVWARIMSRMTGDFPGTRFLSDTGLDFRDIDPWTGFLAEEGGGCPSMRVPFLPGTAPTVPCSAAADTFYYDEALDSLYYVPDTTARFGEESVADTFVDMYPETTVIDAENPGNPIE